MKGLLISGAASGVGKTTVTLALLAAARRRGLVVQPFKGGPDFLDTGHHTRIAGRPARNLDTWMLSKEANLDVLAHASRGADLILVEGMMGLFDGKGGGEEGSSAEIARLFKLPVVLVLDAAKSARSLAAVLLGFEIFDPQLELAGVILNRVAGERHFRMLEEAILPVCRTPILGWLPREPGIAIPERHLGLRTAEEADFDLDHRLEHDAHRDRQIDRFAALAEAHLNLEALLSLECGLPLNASSETSPRILAADIRIGVPRDRAFSFYYEDNLDLLRAEGAEIVSFSPLCDASLPADLDALYIGGGYPELYARQLSSNTSLLAAVREFAASDRPIYAECGGLIYLSQQIQTAEGSALPMTGVLPFQMEMTGRLVRFGYATVEIISDCLAGARGITARGHSFHYSRIVHPQMADAPEGARPCTAQSQPATHYRVHYSLTGRQEDEGYGYRNVLASYLHLHFRAIPSLAPRLVETARCIKARSYQRGETCKHLQNAGAKEMD
jgi:cobyrinic acid a,c-diamide synthase